MTEQVTPERPILRTRDRTIYVPAVGKRGRITNSTTTMYTAPSKNASMPTDATDIATAFVTYISLCNTDTSARTVTLYVVESGGTAADDRAVFKDLSIPAKTTAEYTYPNETFPLASAETIQAVASVTNVVTIRIGVKAVSYAAG